ncbi:uncharacterized protein MELLADRAFT_107740 [Melampsora larici-populina 98AG31]|uniref:Secreted protein n=1 Tax=Melampsora larici-populina (strain 98AG31 / pathotype 3-4-7) TaxID=747676 RepID=F4RQS9_MELLP|nr:uncharacterized protein MELLADRAFT_107740 [Melampsora larici-populina 98AG31]EGG05091.1 hypothetical protein MELLADRAFT_107740 [Melampsora larici-populina 98AG31]
MVRLSIVWVWIAGISVHLTISMDTNPENIRVNSRLQEIQPSRQISTARGDMNNICRDSSSTYLDPSVRLTLKRPKLAPQGEPILSHEQHGVYQSLEDREGSSKVELWMEKKSTTDHYPSSAEIFDSNNHKIAGICPIPNHRGVEQKEHHTARELNFDLNQEPMDHDISPKFYKNIPSKGKSNTLLVESTKKGIESKSSIRMDSEPKASEIDIKNFHLHNPDKMCSAAAIHYTKELIMALSDRYTPRGRLSEYPSWESGKEIWTSEILLPFVYFIVSCNPSRKIWRYIKLLTNLLLRTYHKSSIETETLSDQEKLSRFLLWHTEVIYHTALLEPTFKSSCARLTIRSLSTLARVFWLINDHDCYERSFSKGYCKSMLERHISGTFEEDYQAGYPRNKLNQDLYSSTLENWKKKSNEIWNIGKYVDWSKFLIHTQDESDPILLKDQDIETLKNDPKLTVSMKYWEKDLKNMLLFIKPSPNINLALPHFSLEKICRGIDQFIKQKLTCKKQEVDLHKPTDYQVTLYSSFLHQKTDDKSFERFW